MENMKESHKRAVAAINGTKNKSNKPFINIFDAYASQTPMTKTKTGKEYFEKMAASRILRKEAEFYESRS